MTLCFERRTMTRLVGVAVALIVLTLSYLPVTVQAANRTIGRAEADERRVALVIGNGAYKSNPLKNPVNDARAMAKSLAQCGFSVTKGENLDQKQMRKAIIKFGWAIKKGGVGLFYFAGHGIQVEGENYLIPLETEMIDEEEIAVEAVGLKYVLARMAAAKNQLNIVILDACRDNPFERSMRSGGSQGLAFVTAPSGTLIAYATSPGKTAADGSGKHGIYTGALIAALKTPGLPLEKIFRRTREAVVRATNSRQVPWESSSVMGADFYFLAKAPSETASDPKKKSSGAKDEGESDPVKQNDKARLVELLELAQAALEENRLIKPKGTNALDYYLRVLDAYPNNNKALSGLNKIVGKYVFLARRRIEVQDWAKAETFLNRASTVMEGDSRVLAVRDELRTAKGKWQRAKVVTTTTIATTTTTEANIPTTSPPIPVGTPGPSGEYWTNSIGIKFRLIPAGSFKMGSQWRLSDEWPVKTIAITHPFYMGVYEVTQEQWRKIMNNNPSRYRGDDRPVENISWNDANEFINKLNILEDENRYRLPTEAEWEYACRAGSKATWYFGELVSGLEDHAWYAGNSENQTHPVGLKIPNSWGLYDMHGNVFEWCRDWFDSGYYWKTPKMDPKGPASGQSRVH